MTSKYLIRNAGISTFWRALGILSGTVLDAIILARFGLGYETDALFVSLAIPTMITSALEVQAPKILVPTFTLCTVNEGNEGTSDLMSILMTTFAVILVAAIVVLSALAHVLIKIQAPGFHARALHLGVRLFIVLAWFTLFQGLAPLLQSFLFSRHRYSVPSLNKLVTSISAILVVTLFYARLGIYSVAIGMVFGSALNLVLLGVMAKHNGLNWRFCWRPADVRVREIVKMFGNPMVGHVLTEGKMILENSLASLLGGGSLSILRYATRIVEAISGVLLRGILTSSLPLISIYASEKKLAEMKKSLRDAICLIIFVALPVSCWLIFTCQPMVTLLFQRGRFTNVDAAHTAILIVLLTPYVIFSRLIGITQTPFYAKLDTKTPLLSVILFLAVYISTVLLLSRGLGIYAFPISSSIASVATAVLMSALLHRAFGPLGWTLLRKFGLRMAVVMAITICAFVLGNSIGEQFLSESVAAKLIRFLVPTALGFCGFLAASFSVRLVGTRHLQALVTR